MKFIFVLFLSLAALVVACTEPGAVGESFLPNDIIVRVDTFLIENDRLVDIPTFSTTSQYLSAGRYDDALFGSVEAVSYFVPRIGFLDIGTEDADSLQLSFEFVPNKSLFYGDTTQASREFGLFYITESWRSGTMNHDNVLDIATTPIATFIYNGQDRVIVPMPFEYITELIRYESLADSSGLEGYINDFPGIALKAIDAQNLIIPFYEDSLDTRLFTSATDSVGTTVTGTYRAAYSVEKGGSNYPLPSGVQKLSYDWKPSYSFNFFSQLSRLGQFNLSSAFLQINEATDILESTLPAGHIRPQVNALRTFIKRPSEVNFSFVGDSPNFNLIYDDSLNYFVYNMNSINDWKNNFNLDTTLTFYMVPNLENGILYQSLIFDQNNQAAIRPRVVLTRVEPAGANE